MRTKESPTQALPPLVQNGLLCINLLPKLSLRGLSGGLDKKCTHTGGGGGPIFTTCSAGPGLRLRFEKRFQERSFFQVASLLL
jgi:hypothetical protein